MIVIATFPATAQALMPSNPLLDLFDVPLVCIPQRAIYLLKHLTPDPLPSTYPKSSVLL